MIGLKKSIIIYAPNVHTGGGLSLLNELLACPSMQEVVCVYFDIRAKDKLTIPDNIQVFWTRPTFFSRLKIEILLFLKSSKENNVVMLNNLPPLFKSSAYYTLFIQNRILLEKQIFEAKFNKSYLRVMVERAWLRLFKNRIDTIIVQTETMKKKVQALYLSSKKYPNIRVFPFAKSFEKSKFLTTNRKKYKFDFFYPANGNAHKNHAKLFLAWRELAALNIYPCLAVTLDASNEDLLNIIKQLQQDGVDVVNLGWLNQQETIETYLASNAIIFPSLTEAFGLPLVEATQFNLPVLASELDYVYDVCKPLLTFNPLESSSIARAVKKYLGVEDIIRPIKPAEDFTRFVFGLPENLRSDIDE